MKTNYSELVGKTLTWRFTSGTEITAQVDGCDYYIGITISEVGNPNRRLCCYNGKLSPNYKDMKIKYHGKKYRRLFHNMVKNIKTGLLDGPEHKNFRLNLDSSFQSLSPTSQDCPFAQ